MLTYLFWSWRWADGLLLPGHGCVLNEVTPHKALFQSSVQAHFLQEAFSSYYSPLPDDSTSNVSHLTLGTAICLSGVLPLQAECPETCLSKAPVGFCPTFPPRSHLESSVGEVCDLLPFLLHHTKDPAKETQHPLHLQSLCLKSLVSTHQFPPK